MCPPYLRTVFTVVSNRGVIIYDAIPNLLWTGLLTVLYLYAASSDHERGYRQSLKNEIQRDRRELQDSRQEFERNRRS